MRPWRSLRIWLWLFKAVMRCVTSGGPRERPQAWIMVPWMRSYKYTATYSLATGNQTRSRALGRYTHSTKNTCLTIMHIIPVAITSHQHDALDPSSYFTSQFRKTFTNMSHHKYRHKCVRCKRSRSSTFHRQFPAGPGYPTVKGVCRRCRGSDEVSMVHIHHHHWYILEESTDSQTLGSAELLHSSIGKEESPRRGSQHGHPEQSELPASPPPYQRLPPGRAELADGSTSAPSDIVIDRGPAIASPPPPV